MQQSLDESFPSHREQFGPSPQIFQLTRFRVDQVLKSLTNGLASNPLDVKIPATPTSSSSATIMEELLSQDTYVGFLPLLNMESRAFLDLDIHNNWKVDPKQVADEHDWRSHLKHRCDLVAGLQNLTYEAHARPEWSKSNHSHTEESVKTHLYTAVVRVWGLAALTLLQIWVDELVEDKKAGLPSKLTDFEAAAEALLRVTWGTQIDLGGGRVITDIGLLLKDGDDVQAFAAVDAKRTAAGLQCHKFEGGEVTSDEFLERMLPPRQPMATPVRSLSGLWSSHGMVSPGGWQGKTLKRVAQMASQAERVKSRLVLFTSIYGFTRIGCHVPIADTAAPSKRALLLSENVTRDFGHDPENRRDGDACYNFIRLLYSFVLHSFILSQTHTVLPSGRRVDYDWLCIPPLEVRVEPFTERVYSLWRRSAWALILLLTENLLALWPSALLPLLLFETEHFSGRFESTGKWGCLPIPHLRLDPISSEHDGRQVFINRRARIVVKVFRTREDFVKESDIYNFMYNKCSCIVPPLYGAFRNNLSNLDVLVIGEVGKSLLEEIGKDDCDSLARRDRQQISKAVKILHGIGVHHHDLKLDNIVRDADGQIRLVDFGNASVVDPRGTCKWGANGCPDTFWKLLNSSLDSSCFPA